MGSSVIDSPYTSYSDTAAAKRVITDVISLITPHDAPFIEAIGGLDGAASKFDFVNGKSTEVEWLEDELESLVDVLAVATLASNATSATVVDASKFQPGHIIQMDLQTFWVSAVNTTTQVLTFSSLGGTAAEHNTGDVVTIVGMARLEGDDSDALAATTRYTGTNYTQIFHAEVKVTRTQNQKSQYGIGEEFEYQASKKVPGLMRQLEKWVLIGDASSAGSATTARIMAGIPSILGDTNSASGTTLTKAKFEAAVKLAWADGGDGPWVAPVSATNFAIVCGIYDSSSYLRVERTETVVGMPPVEKIITPYGDVLMLLDRWATDTEIYLIDKKHAGMLTYYPFTQEMLAKDGDSIKGEVIGEFTFCLRQVNAHASLQSVTA